MKEEAFRITCEMADLIVRICFFKKDPKTNFNAVLLTDSPLELGVCLTA